MVNGLSALRGGGQTYLINLFRYFEGYSNIRTFIIVPPQIAPLFQNFSAKTIVPKLASKSLLNRVIWEAFRLPGLLKELDTDLLYCPGGTIPLKSLGGCKLAVAFRNMLPFDDVERKRYPIGYMRLRLKVLKLLQTYSFKKADLIIFLSEYAKNRIEKEVFLRKGLSVVIPHGVGELFRGINSSRKKIFPFEYVLYVSYLDYYKNQLEVVTAWKYLKECRGTKEKLILIGPASVKYFDKVKKLIRKYRLIEDVMCLGSIDYENLPDYYHGAKLNIFASTCENCPNILLEAMASGRPVFCSNHMPMPEFGNNAVIYFEPYKPKELADLLCRYLDNTILLQNMGKMAFDRSLKFDSIINARKTWSELIKLT